MECAFCRQPMKEGLALANKLVSPFLFCTQCDAICYYSADRPTVTYWGRTWQTIEKLMAEDCHLKEKS